MNRTRRKHIVILGNGISGITTARFVRKQSDHQITVISAESDHFYSRTALMYIYMGHMKYEHTKPYEDWFWKKNRIDLVRDYAHKIDTGSHNVHLASGHVIPYDVLVLATGSQSNKFGWPGQDLEGVQGLYGLADLDRLERYTQEVERAVIVGGGLIGVELAEMLHARHIPVTFLVREQSYMDYLLPADESVMINREIQRHHIDLRLGTELKEILPDSQGRVRAVVTGDGEKLACQFVGLTAGVHPNLDVVSTTGIETGKGILVNAYFETNVPDVYAIGDCAQFREPLPGRRPIEQLWYTGRMHGKTLASTLCGQRTAYQPGVFFNSAKFFDIEYQTYGTISASLGEQEKTLYWEHPDQTKSLRLNYDRDTEALIGVNLMGIRYRHEVCETWIRESWELREVLKHLGAANYDPEFFPRFEEQLIALYNQQNPDNPIESRKRKGFFAGLMG